VRSLASTGVTVKSLIAVAAGSIGIPEWSIRKQAGRRYVILMYHRILPPAMANATIQAGMYVFPETFEMHLGYLKKHFQLLPLSEQFSSSNIGTTAASARPACILTFDDGWRDFYRFAYPVLKRNRIPATVFLPTRYIGTNERFWTDRLARLLSREVRPGRTGETSRLPKGPLADRIAGLTGAFDDRLENAIRILKDRQEGEIEEVLDELSKGVDSGGTPEERVFLDWKEVREMMESGLISFGSHTHSHRILVHLAEDEIRAELARSKEVLLREGAVDPSFVSFCYPNGSLNQRIVALVREAGYQAAVSTRPGWNGRQDPPFELSRVAIHQDMTASGAMLGCRIAGIL
jgi:peptidoglycan/xylan/chitin deacetylase (PgdA/CDA1 family)